MKTIAVDAGHGGGDYGGTTLGPAEKVIAMQYAVMLGAMLKERGHKVVLTRTDDSFVSLSKRAALANALAADLFVSVHANASNNPGARGPWTLHAAGSRRGKEIATSVQSALARVLTGKADAVYPDDSGWTGGRRLAVLRRTAMPAILIELGFMTNQTDIELMTRPDIQARVCRAVADALHAELGGVAVPEPTIPEKLDPIDKGPPKPPSMILEPIVVPRPEHIDEIVRIRGIAPEAAKAGLEVAEVFLRAVADGQSFDLRKQIVTFTANALAGWIRRDNPPAGEKK